MSKIYAGEDPDPVTKSTTPRPVTPSGVVTPPEAADQPDVYTLNDLWVNYLENHAKPNKKTWKDDVEKAERDLLPLFGNRPVSSITRRELAQHILAVAARPRRHGAGKGVPGKIVEGRENKGIYANRLLALITKIFNYGINNGLIEHNPAHGIPRPRPTRTRDRVLSESEIRKIWIALEKQTPQTAAILKLQLLTGQRGKEVRTVEWHEIDDREMLWTLPKEKAKNQQENLIPLSPEVHDIFKAMRAANNGSNWVFPSPTNNNECRNNINMAARAVSKESGVDFAPHDLRRTMSTFMTGKLKIDRRIVDKITNHKDGSVGGIYDRCHYLDEKRDALNRWAKMIYEIVARKEGDQLPTTAA